MTIIEWNELCRKGKKKKDRIRVIKTMNHCHDGTGWMICDFWWIDKNDVSRCLMFGGCVKFKSNALNICNKMYGSDYEGNA